MSRLRPFSALPCLQSNPCCSGPGKHYANTFNRLFAMSDFAPRPDTDADQEWENLMRLLHTQAPAQPRPFFYRRVQARLALGASQFWLPGWVRRPAYAVLLGALVLALSGDDAAFASGAAPVAASQPAPR